MLIQETINMDEYADNLKNEAVRYNNVLNMIISVGMIIPIIIIVLIYKIFF